MPKAYQYLTIPYRYHLTWLNTVTTGSSEWWTPSQSRNPGSLPEERILTPPHCLHRPIPHNTVKTSLMVLAESQPSLACRSIMPVGKAA